MSIRKHSILALAVGSVLAGASYNWAQQAAPAGGDAPAAHGASAEAGMQVDMAVLKQLKMIQQEPQMAPDRLFALDAAMHNEAEVAVSKVAAEKATDPKVKAFAAQMVKDHEMAGQKMMPVAQSLKLTPPKGLPSIKQEMIRTMGMLEGKAFDTKYVAHMYAGHAHDVAAFETAAATAMNPQLKQFATELLPTLRHHKMEVTELATSMGVVAPMAGGKDAANTSGPPASHTGHGEADKAGDTAKPGVNR